MSVQNGIFRYEAVWSGIHRYLPVTTRRSGMYGDVTGTTGIKRYIGIGIGIAGSPEIPGDPAGSLGIPRDCPGLI